MSRIAPIEPHQASSEVRAVYDRIEDMGFSLLNVFKMFANHAGILDAFARIATALYADAKLAPRYRELAYLRASQINACHY